jgi:hypothetical protein
MAVTLVVMVIAVTLVAGAFSIRARENQRSMLSSMRNGRSTI